MDWWRWALTRLLACTCRGVLQRQGGDELRVPPAVHLQEGGCDGVIICSAAYGRVPARRRG